MSTNSDALPFDPRDDAALLAALRRGVDASGRRDETVPLADDPGFTALYDRYHRWLYGLGMRTLRTRDGAVAMVGGTLRSILLTPLVRPEHLRPAVARAAYDVCLRIGEPAGTRPVDGAGGGDVVTPGLTAEAPTQVISTLDTSQLGELRRLMWRATAGLTLQERLLFELEWHDQLDTPELLLVVGGRNAATTLARARARISSTLTTAVAVWYGTEDCDHLRRLVRHASGASSESVRRALRGTIDQHIFGFRDDPGCAVCQATQEQYSLEVLGAALPVFPPAPALRAQVLSAAAGPDRPRTTVASRRTAMSGGPLEVPLEADWSSGPDPQPGESAAQPTDAGPTGVTGGLTTGPNPSSSPNLGAGPVSGPEGAGAGTEADQVPGVGGTVEDAAGKGADAAGAVTDLGSGLSGSPVPNLLPGVGGEADGGAAGMGREAAGAAPGMGGEAHNGAPGMGGHAANGPGAGGEAAGGAPGVGGETTGGGASSPPPTPYGASPSSAPAETNHSGAANEVVPHHAPASFDDLPPLPKRIPGAPTRRAKSRSTRRALTGVVAGIAAVVFSTGAITLARWSADDANRPDQIAVRTPAPDPAATDPGSVLEPYPTMSPGHITDSGPRFQRLPGTGSGTPTPPGGSSSPSTGPARPTPDATPSTPRTPPNPPSSSEPPDDGEQPSTDPSPSPRDPDTSPLLPRGLGRAAIVDVDAR